MIITDRNGWIDVLRASSALAVVLFHFNAVMVPSPELTGAMAWHLFWNHGHYGVAVFFTLSGFCLFPGWQAAAGCTAFLRRRFSRIFPPYWGSLLLIGLLALAAKLFTGVNDVVALPRDARSIAATLLLLTDPVTALPTINWVYWTLTSLIAFYLLVALGLLARQQDRLVGLAWLHGLLCLTGTVWPVGHASAPFFIQHWPLFGCGLALATFFHHRPVGGIMLLVSLGQAAWSMSRETAADEWLAVSGLTTLLLALGRNRGFPQVLQPLARIGIFSYSLYLVHVPVGVYVLLRFLPARFTFSLAYIGSQLLLLATTVAVAGLFYLVAERPFLPQRRTPAMI